MPTDPADAATTTPEPPAPADGEILPLDPPAPAGVTSSPLRTTLTVALVVALLVLGASLTLRYRHDHRDEWGHDVVAWRGFDVSDDGRTLTFHAWGTGPCAEPTGITFSSDPTVGGPVTATLDTRWPHVRDGHVQFCNASLQIDSPWKSVTLDRPVPDGTIITDGTPADQLDPMFCGHPVSQVVRAPTVLAPTWSCETGS